MLTELAVIETFCKVLDISYDELKLNSQTIEQLEALIEAKLQQKPLGDKPMTDKEAEELAKRVVIALETLAKAAKMYVEIETARLQRGR